MKRPSLVTLALAALSAGMTAPTVLPNGTVLSSKSRSPAQRDRDERRDADRIKAAARKRERKEAARVRAAQRGGYAG